MKGVDVSYFNGNIDWQAVKNAHIKFAVCRCSYGKKHFDETFYKNVTGAHKAGLICGAYHYSYALTPKDAKQEAQYVKWLIDNTGLLLELPVFFDMEDADNYKHFYNFDFSKKNITVICKAFIDEIKPLNCGVYASYNWLENLIDWKSLKCPIWNAQWSNSDSFKGYLWQFTDRLEIGGKYFDGDFLYD